MLRSYVLSLLVTSFVAAQSPYFQYLGCFVTSPRNIVIFPNNEGKGYPELDGDPYFREDTVMKCFWVSLRRGHNVFAFQNYKCLSMVDTVPTGSYSQNRTFQASCSMSDPDNMLNVYQIHPSLLTQKPNYFNMGCFNDSSTNRAMTSNEGKGYPELTGTPSTRANAVDACFQLVTRLRHPIFGVQSGSCFSSSTLSMSSISRYGAPSACPTNGTGANLVNNVYIANISSAISSLGCWNDAPLGGFEGVRFLANISSSLPDPISHCAGIALSRVGPNVNVFAIQQVSGNSSILRCSAQRDVVPNGSYSTYGTSTTCPSKGTGAVGVNHVYHFRNSSRLEFNWDNLGYTSVGCYRAPPATKFALRNASFSIHDCYTQASQLNHPVFFVYASQCLTGFDFVPGGDYARLGPAQFCRYDGLGESLPTMDTYRVYLVKNFEPKSLSLGDLPRMGNASRFPFSSLGCVLLPGLPDQFWRIYTYGTFTAESCHDLALSRKHNLFGLAYPSYCFSTLDIIPGGIYSQQPRTSCPSHVVSTAGFGFNLIQLYQINSLPSNNPEILTLSSNWTHVGCFAGPSMAPINDGDDRFSILDGYYPNGDYVMRVDAIGKCYQVAKLLNHTHFGLDYGGQCSSSSNKTLFTNGGPSSQCFNDRRGGMFAYPEQMPRYYNSALNLFKVVI